MKEVFAFIALAGLLFLGLRLWAKKKGMDE